MDSAWASIHNNSPSHRRHRTRPESPSPSAWKSRSRKSTVTNCPHAVTCWNIGSDALNLALRIDVQQAPNLVQDQILSANLLEASHLGMSDCSVSC